MRPILIVALGCLLTCASLSAAPPGCVTETLASYIELGAEGCTFAGNTFANFRYSAKATGGARTIPADEIVVTPLLVVPEETRFSFSARWSVGKDQSQDSIISYTTVLLCGDTRDAQMDLTLGRANIGGFVGSVTVDQSSNVGTLSVFDRCTEVCRNKANDSFKFTPVSVVLSTAHVKLTGGINGASLTEFVAGLNRCIPCI